MIPPKRLLRTDEFPLPDEARRLAALHRYDILDTPPDGSFDRITAIAADLFSVPISIVSLVDHDRIWFKSHHGLDVQQIERAPGLCASAILQTDPLILTDAKCDIRSLANPLVAGEFGLRFYVGVPLRTSDGYNLGTLCVIDREPRSVSKQQIALLEDLANVVMDQMELRLSARRAIASLSQALAEKDSALHRAEMMAKEIDHRVMNSLNLVASLLLLQSSGFNNPEARAELAAAAARVSAVARVHQHIFSSEGVEKTECRSYLERLCSDLSTVLLPASRGEIVVQGTRAYIPTERIIPVGLIVNELVTNAAKHGARRIVVCFERTAPSGYSLSVSNDGAALPADFKPTTTSGLGMKIVSALTKQLGGQLLFSTAEGEQGARFTILFEDPPAD